MVLLVGLHFIAVHNKEIPSVFMYFHRLPIACRKNERAVAELGQYSESSLLPQFAFGPTTTTQLQGFIHFLLGILLHSPLPFVKGVIMRNLVVNVWNLSRGESPSSLGTENQWKMIIFVSSYWKMMKISYRKCCKNNQFTLCSFVVSFKELRWKWVAEQGEESEWEMVAQVLILGCRMNPRITFEI